MNETKMPTLSYVGSPNRYLCTVLEEMRECLKSLNFAYFGSLIEEAQMLGNRMEASLNDCKKYITKKPESIHKKMWEKLRAKIIKMVLANTNATAAGLFIALGIEMEEIEKELNNEN